jgi:hypothetical protein
VRPRYAKGEPLAPAMQLGAHGQPAAGADRLAARCEHSTLPCALLIEAIGSTYPSATWEAVDGQPFLLVRRANPQPWISHRRVVITDPFLASWDVRLGVEPVTSG